tara:strand:- start:4132 stop:4863 length:732 start_codon:yes stop_codon:yes gene_type:complete
MVNVTIWNEYHCEKEDPIAEGLYPSGIHNFIASFLTEAGYNTTTATLASPEHGLSNEVLDTTDVLLWWSHNQNEHLDDSIANRVAKKVLEGMGFIVLHSALRSKPFHLLMGTSCNLKRRNADEIERVWVINPGHPIVQNLSNEYIEFPQSQIFGEPFDIPPPEDLVLISWNEGGEVFRSGCCWTRGNGKIFFLGPGHETHPIYHNSDIQLIIRNAIDWASPLSNPPITYGKLTHSTNSKSSQI